MSVGDEDLEQWALSAGVEHAYDLAVHGKAPVPAYTVSTDPEDESFTALCDTPLDAIDRALIAGDVRRRFLLGVETGRDEFADIRVPWPHQ